MSRRLTQLPCVLNVHFGLLASSAVLDTSMVSSGDGPRRPLRYGGGARMYAPNHGLKLGERVNTRGGSSGACASAKTPLSDPMPSRARRVPYYATRCCQGVSSIDLPARLHLVETHVRMSRAVHGHGEGGCRRCAGHTC